MRFASLLATLVTLASFAGTSAADSAVPIDLQVDLVRKIVRFERGFLARCGGEVLVVISVRGSDVSTTRTAAQLQVALEHAHDIGGKPIRVVVSTFSTPLALKSVLSAQHVAILFLPPGFEAELPAIASALVAQPIITVTTESEQVAAGAVLGFELVASKAKIELNLGQARRQGLDFDSELFRLARIVQ